MRVQVATAIERAFANKSGRLIAVCRWVLAAVFLLVVWADPQQPVRASGLG